MAVFLVGVERKRAIKIILGEEEQQTHHMFGYKAHISLNAGNGLIISLETSSGEILEGNRFCSLVDHDLEQVSWLEIFTGKRITMRANLGRISLGR
jgi:hypothetical protein